MKLERFAWSDWILKYLIYFGYKFRPRPQAGPDGAQLVRKEWKTLDIQNGSKNRINDSTFFGINSMGCDVIVVSCDKLPSPLFRASLSGKFYPESRLAVAIQSSESIFQSPAITRPQTQDFPAAYAAYYQ